MLPQESRQEIVLVATRPVIKKTLLEREAGDKERELTVAGLLEEACSNGLLSDAISSAPVNCANGDKMFHWKVFVADSIFCVELYQTPSVIDHLRSLNPYLFLSSVNYS